VCHARKFYTAAPHLGATHPIDGMIAKFFVNKYFFRYGEKLEFLAG
jgi:hypothetical protein